LLAEAYFNLLCVNRMRMQEDQTLKYARHVLQAAQQLEDLDFALFLYGEVIHAYTVYWRFDEALAVARKGEALLARAPGGAEPSYRYSLSQMFYLFERYDEAYEHIVKGIDALARQRRSLGRFSPDRQHTLAILTNMRGLVAVAREQWDEACEAAELFAANPAARGNRNAQVHVTGLIVRARLGRNAPGDLERAIEAFACFDPDTATPDARMDFVVVRARIAARLKDAQAPQLIAAALTEVEEVAARMPLDADMQFADLACAANEIGEGSLELRARAQHEKYREMRRAKIAG
jgi:hypothetical protein